MADESSLQCKWHDQRRLFIAFLILAFARSLVQSVFFPGSLTFSFPVMLKLCTCPRIAPSRIFNQFPQLVVLGQIWVDSLAPLTLLPSLR